MSSSWEESQNPVIVHYYFRPEEEGVPGCLGLLLNCFMNSCPICCPWSGAPGKDHEIRGWALVIFQIYLPITAFSVTCPCGSYTTGRNQECKVEGGLPNPFQHTFTQLLIMKFHKRWGIWNKCLRREEGRHTDGHCFRYTEK